MERTTVREIRRMLFDNDYNAIAFGEAWSNKQIRDVLYQIDNQDSLFEYEIRGNYIYLWELANKEVV